MIKMLLESPGEVDQGYTFNKLGGRRCVMFQPNVGDRVTDARPLKNREVQQSLIEPKL